MMELTINNSVYGFNFGMGFMRDINNQITQPVEGAKGVTQPVGLRFKVAGLIDGDVEALVDVLDAANKGQKPRVTRALLDSYIDDESTDIDALFSEVLNFLSKANATKKIVAQIQEAVERERAKAAANA